jgi:hypothetical protein
MVEDVDLPDLVFGPPGGPSLLQRVGRLEVSRSRGGRGDEDAHGARIERKRGTRQPPRFLTFHPSFS